MTNTDILEPEELTYHHLEPLFNSIKLMQLYKDLTGAFVAMSELDLVERVKPSKTDWRLRIRLWDLINKARDKKNDYNLIYNVDIYEEICGSSAFQSKMRTQAFTAFLFRPIEKFTDELEIMLTVTRHKMWDLMNHIKPVTEKGDVDYRAAKMLMSIHDKLVDRKLGAVRQLIEMKKIQLNVNAGASLSEDLEDMDSEIMDIRTKTIDKGSGSKTRTINADAKGVS